MKNKLSETANILISLCWKNGQPMSIVPYFDVKFEYNDKNYKFTNDVLEEIRSTGLVKIAGENKHSVVLTGIGSEVKDKK